LSGYVHGRIRKHFTAVEGLGCALKKKHDIFTAFSHLIAK
jgi:hypothetical protein